MKQRHRQPKKLSIAELIEAAERSEAAGDLNYAVKLITMAVHKADRKEDIGTCTRNVVLDLLERRADLHIAMQSPELAVQDYQRSLDLLDMDLDMDQQQSNGFVQRRVAIYMYLGQLSTGMEALSFYHKGIDCLLLLILQIQQPHQPHHDASSATDQSNTGMNHTQSELQQQLAKAYTSIAELYLTDLCFEDSAEASCEHNLELALQSDPHSVDALQTLASLQLSQQKTMDAKTTVRSVYDQLKTGCQAMASLVGLRGEDDEDDIDNHHPESVGANHRMAATELLNFSSVQALPPYEFRCQTAKLLLETHQSSEAIDVIGSLLAENDQIIEVWILAGDAFAALEQPNSGDTHIAVDDPPVNDEESELEPPPQMQYWERAMEMLTVVRGELECQLQGDNDNNDDDALQQQMDQVEAQLEDLRTKLEVAEISRGKLR